MIIVEHDEVGRILSTVSYPTSDEAVTQMPLYRDRLFLPQGFQLDWAGHYVSDGEVTDRPGHGITLTGDVLAGVREGSLINIDDQTYTADGSDVELEFDAPGTYRIRVSLWPFLEYEVMYEAKA